MAGMPTTAAAAALTRAIEMHNHLLVGGQATAVAVFSDYSGKT